MLFRSEKFVHLGKDTFHGDILQKVSRASGGPRDGPGGPVPVGCAKPCGTKYSHRIILQGRPRVKRRPENSRAKVINPQLCGVHNIKTIHPGTFHIQFDVEGVQGEIPGLGILDEGVGGSPGASGAELDRKSTRLNSSHIPLSRMPSSA